ncbi:MAG: hypothetical protein K2J59_08405 [Eubacterium sp.]|nr:hypothetical protein [Eubacterium sp.]
MIDIRNEIKETLEKVKPSFDIKVKMAFPDTVSYNSRKRLITYFELSNTDTEIPTVQDIAFQVDLWVLSTAELLEATLLIDKEMKKKGLKRQFVSPDSMMNDPSGYKRKTFRYGSRIDLIFNRFIN